jgi:hypothetical protein
MGDCSAHHADVLEQLLALPALEVGLTGPFRLVQLPRLQDRALAVQASDPLF